MLNLALALGIWFNLTQGAQLCFEEDLPEGAVLRGFYGADRRQAQPQVELSIYSPASSILRNAVLRDNNSFSYAVQESGAHLICLQAAEVQSYQRQARRVFLQLEAGALAGQADDKLAQARQIDQLVHEARLDMRYGAQRMDALEAAAERVSSAVVWTGLLSVAVAGAVAAAKNQWLQARIKHRE